MDTKITIAGVAPELPLLALKAEYFDAIASYNEALKVSEESNSEEYDVELARAETKVETLAYVLSSLGVSLEGNIDPELRESIVDLLTVAAIGEIKEDLAFGKYDLTASFITGEGVTPLKEFNDKDLVLELRRVFGSAKDFSPFEHTNVYRSFLKENTESHFGEMRDLLAELIKEEGEE